MLPAVIKNNSVESEFKSSSVLKILIVDDEIANRLILQDILNGDGYICLHAENGKEAVEIFREESPDLVLMDVIMPEMDGYEATVRIKAISPEDFVPVIFLTALTDEDDLVKCVESGGDDFLSKPYNYIILRARIEAMLRIRKYNRTIQQQKKELSIHQERMEREEKMTETLFRNIVHSDALEVDYIKYILSPVSLFSGDMLIAAKKSSGGLHVMLGDFTGHGMAAATGALPVSGIFYGMTAKGFSIAEIAEEINKKCKEILPTGMFMAACLLEFNATDRILSVWNGGIPDVLIYDDSTAGVSQRVKASHLPLGILERNEFDNSVEIVLLAKDARVFVYSDGITDTINPQHKMFGQARLEKIFFDNVDPDEVFEELGQALSEFQQGTEQSDDITLAEILFDVDAISQTEFKPQYLQKVGNPSATWRICFELQADVLRHTDPLPMIINSITEIQGRNSNHQQLYTILAEIYSNSLEHGLLGLDSTLKVTSEGFEQYYHMRQERLSKLSEGSIKINATHVPEKSGGKLVLRVEDSGKGFDFTSNKGLPMAGNHGHSGRGVPLLRSLCESVDYQGCGNIVEVVYVW